MRALPKAPQRIGRRKQTISGGPEGEEFLSKLALRLVLYGHDGLNFHQKRAAHDGSTPDNRPTS